MSPFEEVQKKLEQLKAVVQSGKRLVILGHDQPDPDGISSAMAFTELSARYFGVPAIFRFAGEVSRPENREMIRRLRIKINPLQKSEIRPTDRFAVVDCQPHTGNLRLPEGMEPHIVIDHHPLRKATKAAYIDVRPDYGATATIMSEYLLAAAVEIKTTLATALCYGISSETQHLGRGAAAVDARIYSAIFPAANQKILSQIENPNLPREYFKTLNRALHHTYVYKNALVSTLGEVTAPDFVPIVADLLLKCERISWSLCIGRYDNRILASVRTSSRKANAGAFLRSLVGKRGTAGGHGLLAGGQIVCQSTSDLSCDQYEKDLRLKFFKKLGFKEGAEMIPLLVEENTKMV
ncbi:MAG: DHH family phosphoesterase [Candidatus Omnitrophica bacterium]|nr:DHH family phosphoesterase [Candidatus Omnitrophota bacterium]